MTVLVEDLSGAGMVRERVRGNLRAEVFADLASVETLWRALETEFGVLVSPYQRFDWVAAHIEGVFGTDPVRQASALCIIVLRDTADRPRVLIPLQVSRERGVRVARVIGGKHANVQMPLFVSREAAAMMPEDLFAAMLSAGRTVGIDAFALDYQPRFWDGAANPLSAGGQPCPSDAYGLMLGPDPDATLRRVYSAEARKKLRAKERKLVETIGPVEHRVADTPDAAAHMLEAFYAQKQARMAQLGAPDPYACEPIRRFLAIASVSRLTARLPAIEIHALVAVESSRILATFGGAVDAKRFSGMWTSFDTDPELGRFSLGDLMLHHLIGQQTAVGRHALDLGVGEARYKASICDETIELVQKVIPVTLRGQIFAIGLAGGTRLKRRVKRSPRLWALMMRLRRRAA